MKALVVFSGGQDSTTCLYWAINKYGKGNVQALTFYYGQRHAREIEAASKIAELADIPHEVLEVDNILAGTSPLTNPNEEVEQYESVEALPGGLEKTFVPGRNMLFLTLAANRAYVNNCDVLVTGVSEEDFGGYPDCREAFIDKMEDAIKTGLDRDIEIITPLIYENKAETVNMALNLGEECMEALGLSHTCYNGQHPPCGKCHACLLRAKGFEEAGIVDPLIGEG